MKTTKKTVNRKKRHAKVRSRISGTPQQPRLVVYRSLQSNYAQLVDDISHSTLLSVSDLKLKTDGKKTERAKKVGLEIARLALEKKISVCVFDRNGYKYHGRVKALAEGAREGGLKF